MQKRINGDEKIRMSLAILTFGNVDNVDNVDDVAHELWQGRDHEL